MTITDATFFTFIVLGFRVTPILSSMLARDCRVKVTPCLSPVPSSPTTRPYPTNWLSLTPSIFDMSFTRIAHAADEPDKNRESKSRYINGLNLIKRMV